MAMEDIYGCNVPASEQDVAGLRGTNSVIRSSLEELSGRINQLDNAWVNQTREIASKRVIVDNLRTAIRRVEDIRQLIEDVCYASDLYIESVKRANRANFD